MLKALMIKPGALNKAAMLAILPLMVFAIMATTRVTASTRLPLEDPREGTIVVANLRGASLTFQDLGGDGRSRTLILPAGPHELVTAGGRLYATLALADQLVEVDPDAPGVLRSLTLEGMPHGLALSGDELLVTLDDANALVTVDPESLTELSRSTIGNTPHTVAVDSNGSVFVTASRENELIQLPSGRSQGTGALPESVGIAGQYAVTGNAASSSLSVFKREGLAFAGTITLGGSPVRVIGIGETHVLVALSDTAELAYVDLPSLTVERRIPVAERPDGLCLSPSGRFVGVVSNAKDAVTVLRTTDWRVQISLATGHGPGQCLWLAD
ncbi:hypothetical protein AYO38_02890 [bacterium SCGC AG-212-C10]|nr:hypothetical protein AYO38_02890 [bacterium SCGC AG-212-C10]